MIHTRATPTEPQPVRVSAIAIGPREGRCKQVRFKHGFKIGSTNTNKIHACTTVISRHISHHQHHQDRGGHGDKCCNRIWVVYVPRVLYRHSSTFRSRWQGARPRMFTPPRCEPGALHPLPAHPASLNCEYMALPCRSAAGRHTGRLPGRTQRPPRACLSQR